MQQRKRGIQFVEVDFEFFGQIGQHFFECGGKVAVVVERFDQEGDQRAVARTRLGDAQLRHQVIAQRGARFVDLQRRQVVVVRGVARAAVVVEIPLRRVAVTVAREAVVFVHALRLAVLGALAAAGGR